MKAMNILDLFGKRRHARTGRGPARPQRADPDRRDPFRQSPPAEGSLSRGTRAGALRPRLLLGRGEGLLEARRRLRHRGRLCRRRDAEPDLSGGLQRHDRPQRGRAGRLRSEEDQLRRVLRAFLEAHDPTQGMRQGNDVGTQYRSGIYVADAAQRQAAEAAKTAYETELKKRGFGRVTTEIVDRPPFYFAEDYHQQYLAKNPHGYCGLGGTGVSCPIGTGVVAA